MSSLLLSILLVTLTKLNSAGPLNRLVNILTQPILTPLTWSKNQISQVNSQVIALPRLYSENTKLKEENGHLKIIVKKLSESLDNQEIIKKLSQHTWQVIPLKLVRLDNLATFTGQDLTGIEPGQPLISDDVILGIVKKVESPIVTISPLDQADITFAAQLENGNKGKYIYRSATSIITNLDSNTSFSPRTSVFTLPSNQIPENLIVGQVREIISNQANPVQEASIVLDKTIATAKDFLVIIKP